MNKNNFILKVLVVLIVSSCATQKDIEGLQGQLDELKTGKIATIEQQISSIQASISSLQATNSQLSSFVSILQLETSTIKADLSSKEKALSDSIDNLKSYVDGELSKNRDWASATFATLEQYQALLTELADIKASIQALDKDLRSEMEKAISNSESSMKGWVNDQLAGYYTIAQMDAKLKALADANALNSQAIGKVASDLETAKVEMIAAYQRAISDAITQNNGVIDQKIAVAIKSATDALQSQIDALDSRIAAIEGMVQSVTIIPAYSDGSVIAYENTLYISCLVSPAYALKNLTKDNFRLIATTVQTKASTPVVLNVTKITIDYSKGIVDIEADISALLPMNDEKHLSIAVNIKDETTNLISSFARVVAGNVKPDPRPTKSVYGNYFELPEMVDDNTDGKCDIDQNLYYAQHSFTISGKKYRNFTLCFDGSQHCPIWVAGPLHNVYSGSAARSDTYQIDPAIPAEIQYFSRNVGSGCNKGHLMLSSDRTCSTAANQQVFYYSNIAPQLSTGFNTGGGGWNILEDFVHTQVCSDTLYVVIGTYFKQFTDGYGNTVSPKTIEFGGRSDVGFPTMFYYILMRTKSGNSRNALKDCSASEIKCAAFVRSHTNNLKGQKVTSKDLMSVSDLEKITGLTYFVNVPNAPKTIVNASDWGL